MFISLKYIIISSIIRGTMNKYINASLGLSILVATAGGIYLAKRYMDTKLLDVKKFELEITRVQKGYTSQERDLNMNKLPELFYEFEGRKCFISIDGKNLETVLKEAPSNKFF